MRIPINGESHGVVDRLIAVAIDEDKGSQFGLKWAIDNLMTKGQTIILVHVNVKSASAAHHATMQATAAHHATPRFAQILDGYGSPVGDLDPRTKELFLPFRVYCTRKDIQCVSIFLESTDVVGALLEFVSQSALEVLVFGEHEHSKFGGFLRRSTDIPGNVSKAVPDFCSVFVISTKGKILQTKSASHPAPVVSPLRYKIQYDAHIAVTPLAPCISKRVDRKRTSIRPASRRAPAPAWALCLKMKVKALNESMEKLLEANKQQQMVNASMMQFLIEKRYTGHVGSVGLSSDD